MRCGSLALPAQMLAPLGPGPANGDVVRAAATDGAYFAFRQRNLRGSAGVSPASEDEDRLDDQDEVDEEQAEAELEEEGPVN